MKGFVGSTFYYMDVPFHFDTYSMLLTFSPLYSRLFCLL